MSISILLVDDQPMLRLGFRLVLDAQTDMTVVGEAAEGAEAVAIVASLQREAMAEIERRRRGLPREPTIRGVP